MHGDTKERNVEAVKNCYSNQCIAKINHYPFNGGRTKEMLGWAQTVSLILNKRLDDGFEQLHLWQQPNVPYITSLRILVTNW